MCLTYDYTCRPVPDISDLLQPLEYSIRLRFIPALTGRDAPNDVERELFSLPARCSGLGIVNPCKMSELQFKSSLQIRAPLVKIIIQQSEHYPLTTMLTQIQAKLKARAD